MRWKCLIQGVRCPGGDASGGNPCWAGAILLHSGAAARSRAGAGYPADPAAWHSNGHHHPARPDHHCTTTARTGTRTFQAINKSFSKVGVFPPHNRLLSKGVRNKINPALEKWTYFNCTLCCLSRCKRRNTLLYYSVLTLCALLSASREHTQLIQLNPLTSCLQHFTKTGLPFSFTWSEIQNKWAQTSQEPWRNSTRKKSYSNVFCLFF